MSRIAQELPKVGLVMERVKVIRWLKSIGDEVLRGENLLEVETEKSIVEIEAGASGRLIQILVPPDEEAAVGDTIAWIESSEAQDDGAAAAAKLAGSAAAGAAVESVESVERAIAPRQPPIPNAPRADAGRIRSSPAARKLAADHGIALADIAATGTGDRIQLADVQRAMASARRDVAKGSGLSSMRRAVARAMTLSNATIPQFVVASSVDWTVLKSLRGDLSSRLPPDCPALSLNDFLLQAVARALVEFPGLNATFSGEAGSDEASLVPRQGAHIGLVVAVDDGLLVPVIHQVDTLGLADIARRRVDCVERALKGRLPRDEVGGTFSISNLGVDGPDRFTAIINPPQSAILAVGRQRDCVVAREGQVVVRPMSELALTVDHRVADGRLASQFLARLLALLQGTDWQLT